MPTPRLLDELARHQRETPLGRKLLVGRSAGAARELLRALARSGTSWTGFEATTLRPLALELALPGLVRDGLGVLDEFQEEALVDEAMDAAVGSGPDVFAELLRGPGFRAGVRGAVTALELAAVHPERLAASTVVEAAKRDFLVRVLRGYRARVREEGRVGLAGILARASRALEAGAPLRWDRILLLPGLGLRGSAGRLVLQLRERGARLLRTDAVHGLEPPPSVLWADAPDDPPAPFGTVFLERPKGAPEAAAPVDAAFRDLPLFAPAPGGPSEPPPPPTPSQDSLDLFAAGGIEAELLEVIRRVMGSGRGWHEVEIVTPDPAAYGAVLQALSERLEIPVTFAVGLPVERTLPGRAVASYLEWLREGFPADGLRVLLARGDLGAPRPWHRIPPERLARTLRRLRIGWGRARYMPALDRAVTRARGRLEEAVDPEARVRRDGELQTVLGLRAVVHRLLDTLPERAPGMGEGETAVSPSRIAVGIRRLLGLLRVEGEVDETARDRLSRILDRVEAHLHRPSPLGVALGTLEDHLAIRVPAPRAEGRAPWVSDAGSLHLSDLEHGGLSGRPVTFVVGLDAGRFPGAPLQDPILLDRERRGLSAALPTVADRLAESAFSFAALLARLRGRLTLSYPVWDAAAARTLMPSPVLLQAFRWMEGDPDAGFEALREGLGQPVGRIPRNGPAVDAEDLWLGALASPTGFYAGEASVRAAFPWLDRGRTARDAWRPGVPPSRFTGVVGPDSEAVRAALATPFSPTRLEALGACPLRFFYASVLRLRAPEDPEYRPDRWLDPAQRGSLLHQVFEGVVRAALEEGVAPGSAEMGDRGAALLDGALDELALRVPPPSGAVRDREARALEVDLRCFLTYLDRSAEEDREWIALEEGFGIETPVTLRVGDASISVRGRMDRIDRLDSGELAIVDYKTGGVSSLWAPSTGVWRQGRRLQHLTYSHAAATLLETPVRRFEYHFPSRKGEGRVIAFAWADLQRGKELLGVLLDGARQGAFVPTDDAGDCRFCDFGPICRVHTDRFDQPRSPAADFGEAALEAGFPETRWLARVRGWEAE